MKRIPLASPDISDRERELVREVMDGTTLSGGPMIRRFETAMAERSQRKHAIAVSSGTAALHLIVRGMGIGPGDAVITTPFSFVASSNCVLFEKAEPVFADIEPDTYNLDPEAVRELLRGDESLRKQARAILAVDVFGHPADWEGLAAVADEFGLELIEDSAEALGSELGTRPAGSFGVAGVYAFYPNKQATTGEGGAVLTDDDRLAELCVSMRDQGREQAGDWFDHVRLGFNYRISELHAALGVGQFERLEELKEKRARVVDWYSKGFDGVDGVTLPQAQPGVSVNWFVYVIRFSPEIDRDALARRASEFGIPLRPYFPSIHLTPFYRGEFGYEAGRYPISESVSASVAALPFAPNMSREDVEYVCDRVHRLIDEA
jgi:perosamine synthetase